MNKKTLQTGYIWNTMRGILKKFASTECAIPVPKIIAIKEEEK
jgi:hypothetical protein